MSQYERYKSAEKQLVETLVNIATDRCKESDLPSLLERREQKYHDKTYPNLRPLSAAILDTCSKGTSAPPQLSTALVLARDVIYLRKEHKQLLGDCADAGHDTWLEILETVRADLECIRLNTRTELKIDTRPDVNTKQQQSVNMFASLKVQDLISPLSAQSSSASKSDTMQLLSSLIPLGEQRKRDAAKNLFHELRSIRECVIAVFDRMKAGTTTLATAGHVAAAALGVFNEILYRFHCVSEAAQNLSEQPDARATSAQTQDVFSCDEAWKALIAGRCSLAAGSGTSPDPTFKYLLHRLDAIRALQETCDFEGSVRGWDALATHMFARHHKAARHTPELAFLYQQFMDLYHSLSGQLENIPQYTADCLIDMSNSIAQLSLAGKDNTSPLATLFARQSDTQARVLRAIPSCQMASPDMQSYQEQTTPQAFVDPGNSHSRLLDLPLYSSTLVGMCLEEYQVRSWLFARDHGLFVAAAHLYRACKVAGFCNVDWKDMDFAIDNMPFSEIGISSASSLLNCAKDYGIAMGVEQKKYRTRIKEVKKVDGNPSTIRLPLPPMTDSAAKDWIDERLLGSTVYHPIAQALQDNQAPNDFKPYHVTRALYSMVEPGVAAPELKTIPEMLFAFRKLMDGKQIALYFDYGGPFLLSCRDMLLSITSTSGIATAGELQFASPTTIRDFVDDFIWNAAKDEVSEDSIMRYGVAGLQEAARRMELVLAGKESQSYDRAVALTNIKLTDYTNTMATSTTRITSPTPSARSSLEPLKGIPASTVLKHDPADVIGLLELSNTARVETSDQNFEDLQEAEEVFVSQETSNPDVLNPAHLANYFGIEQETSSSNCGPRPRKSPVSSTYWRRIAEPAPFTTASSCFQRAESTLGVSEAVGDVTRKRQKLDVDPNPRDTEERKEAPIPTVRATKFCEDLERMFELGESHEMKASSNPCEGMRDDYMIHSDAYEHWTSRGGEKALSSPTRVRRDQVFRQMGQVAKAFARDFKLEPASGLELQDSGARVEALIPHGLVTKFHKQFGRRSGPEERQQRQVSSGGFERARQADMNAPEAGYSIDEALLDSK